MSNLYLANVSLWNNDTDSFVDFLVTGKSEEDLLDELKKSFKNYGTYFLYLSVHEYSLVEVDLKTRTLIRYKAEEDFKFIKFIKEAFILDENGPRPFSKFFWGFGEAVRSIVRTAQQELREEDRKFKEELLERKRLQALHEQAEKEKEKNSQEYAIYLKVKRQLEEKK